MLSFVMADDLKNSVGELESPLCPACQVKTKWYWSMKVTVDPVKIDHFFDCPKCRRVIRITTSGDGFGVVGTPSDGGQQALPFECRVAA